MIEFPAYTYVPGGPHPHPVSDPRGHSHGRPPYRAEPVVGEDWAGSADFVRGVALFNAGYYWEAHEAWEFLWHAHGRSGPAADVLRGLIKLAAAGVKLRQGQAHGVATHARRAAEIFRAVAAGGRARLLGLELSGLAADAERIVVEPPRTELPPGAPASPVLPCRLEPR